MRIAHGNVSDGAALAAGDQAFGRQFDQMFFEWHVKVRPVVPDLWSPWSPMVLAKLTEVYA